MKLQTELPVYLFHQGTAEKAYDLMGSHPVRHKKIKGYVFRVWAPHAKQVFVTGEFCDWEACKYPMKKLTQQGIWEIFIPNVEEMCMYRYIIEDKKGKFHQKTDPYAYHMETPPATASKTYDLNGYEWKDKIWLEHRNSINPYNSPMNIYEVHMGSWRRYKDGHTFDYKKLSEELIPYVKEMGYTHIELMPVSEHPFDGSWGYQVTGYYAPTSRFGTPKDFMKFIDLCHQAGLGVILDWVPGHFPKDDFGLRKFDGGNCYEYSDPYKNEQQQWGTMVFDWGRNEVKSFLISNAAYWFDKYHIDGLRVDAVASMLYLDYGKEDGEWRKNIHGGRENLEAVSFFKQLNRTVLSKFKGVLMIAEESTSWPMVTKPPQVGGLGFNFKWNMGWMNDTLDYMKYDPFYRKEKHNALTFPMTYIYDENFILPLSHDEVVHMKGSLINKMPGELEQKFSNLKAYYGYMMAHPGKKLLFMGGEFGQFSEWNYKQELDWERLQYKEHRNLKKFVKDLNHIYLENPAFWEQEEDWSGFKWLSCDDREKNIFIFKRISRKGEPILVICNFAGIGWKNYRINLENMGIYGLYKEILNSDAEKYSGKGQHIKPAKIKKDENGIYISVDIPPLAVVYMKAQ